MLLVATTTRGLRLAPPRRTLKLLVGAHLVPHPDKKDGEDAFYASSKQQALGVADGVGGSKREGVDPGAFSRRLLAHAVSPERRKADEAVATARKAVKDDVLCQKGGSSTLLVATLDDATLSVSNLGDSALIVPVSYTHLRAHET